MSQVNPADGSILKHYRDQLGWTQDDLATRAQLSVRVIAKAEAGERIRHKTAAAIAAAFEQAGCRVSADDLLNHPAALARQFLANYARYHGDCVRHSLDFLSPDIVAHVAGDPDTNPIAGHYRGIAEFERFFKTFFTLFVRDGGTLDNPHLSTSGHEVVAWGYERIRVPQSPPQADGGLVVVRMRFEGGRLVYFEDHYEVAGMMRALNQWAEEFPNAPWVELLRQAARRSVERQADRREAGG